MFDPALFSTLSERALADYMVKVSKSNISVPRSFYESAIPTLDSLDDWHLTYVIAWGVNDAPDIIGPHVARFMEPGRRRSIRLMAFEALRRLPSITPADFQAAERFVASYPGDISDMLQDLAPRVKHP